VVRELFLPAASTAALTAELNSQVVAVVLPTYVSVVWLRLTVSSLLAAAAVVAVVAAKVQWELAALAVLVAAVMVATDNNLQLPVVMLGVDLVVSALLAAAPVWVAVDSSDHQVVQAQVVSVELAALGRLAVASAQVLFLAAVAAVADLPVAAVVAVVLQEPQAAQVTTKVQAAAVQAELITLVLVATLQPIRESGWVTGW
jgi:hypothetical protein